MVDLHTILPRHQQDFLLRVLGEFPVVVLVGARQTGKTTLAQSADVARGRRFVSLDDFSALDLARRDPASLVSGSGPVTIDEIQRAPQLLPAIKREVDRTREPGRFLCTGSANLLLMKQVSESLAGRAFYVEVPPFTWAELERRRASPVLDAAFSARSVRDLLDGIPRGRGRSPGVSLDSAVFRGGFPVASLSETDGARSRWFEGYTSTYVERDVRLLSAVEDLVAFRRFMQAAALRNSALLNLAQLAQDAGVPPTTAGRYLSLLEVSFLVWKLPAFTVNRGKRLAKAPRLVWTDSGLAAHLAGYRDPGELAEDRRWGSWLEAWIGHHLKTWASLHDARPTVSTWRTSAGAEVDFVIEAGRRLLPVEVKATARPVGNDLRGLETFLDLHPEAAFGILACGCAEAHEVSARVAAIPFERLLLG